MQVLLRDVYIFFYKVKTIIDNFVIATVSIFQISTLTEVVPASGTFKGIIKIYIITIGLSYLLMSTLSIASC